MKGMTVEVKAKDKGEVETVNQQKTRKVRK